MNLCIFFLKQDESKSKSKSKKTKMEIVCNDKNIINLSNDSTIIRFLNNEMIVEKNKWLFGKSPKKYHFECCGDCSRKIFHFIEKNHHGIETIVNDVIDNIINDVVDQRDDAFEHISDDIEDFTIHPTCLTKIWPTCTVVLKTQLLFILDNYYDRKTIFCSEKGNDMDEFIRVILKENSDFNWMTELIDNEKLKPNALVSNISRIIWSDISLFLRYIHKDLDYFESMDMDHMITSIKNIYEISNTGDTEDVGELLKKMCTIMVGKYHNVLNSTNFSLVKDMEELKNQLINIMIKNHNIMIMNMKTLCDEIVDSFEPSNFIQIWNFLFPNNGPIIDNESLIISTINEVTPLAIVNDKASYDLLHRNRYLLGIVSPQYLWEIASESYNSDICDDRWFIWSIEVLDYKLRTSRNNFLPIINDTKVLPLLSKIRDEGFSSLHKYLVKEILTNCNLKWLINDNLGSMIIGQNLYKEDAFYLLNTHNNLRPILKHYCLQFNLNMKFKKRKR